MQLPSIDVFIGLIFLFGIAYSFLFQKDKTITTLCAVYIGIVIADSFSQSIFEFFNGNKMIANELWIRGNASTSTIAIVLLLLSVVLISVAISANGSKGAEVSLVEIIIYSILTIALILSSVLNFLPDGARDHYTETSKVAAYLYRFRTLFVVLPPVILILLNFRRKK